MFNITAPFFMPLLRRTQTRTQVTFNLSMPYNLDDYPVLDMQQLKHVVLNDSGILQALKTAFSEDTQKRLDTLDSLCLHPEGAQQPVKKLLHALKGEARSIAAVRLGELAYQLEKEASIDNLSTVFEHLPLLHQEFHSWQSLMEAIDWQDVLQSSPPA